MSIPELIARAAEPETLSADELSGLIAELETEFDRIQADPHSATLQSLATMTTCLAAVKGCITERKARAKGLTASGTPRGDVGGGLIPRMSAMQGGGQRSPSAPQGIPVTVTAAVGSRNTVAGSPLTSVAELGEVMSDALRSMAPGKVPEPRRTVVARAQWEYPAERQLGDSVVENTAKLDAVCSLSAPRYRDGALVASGGVCLPVNVDYSVPTWSTADRPLRDGLPSFQATRGGIRFVQPPDIGVPSLQGTASGAGLSVGIWTEATDANPAGQTKPVWTVACGAEQLVYVNAIPTRVQFGNMQSRFAPEQVAANTQQAVAISAREAELELLTLIANACKSVEPASYLGATRDLLSSVDLLAAQYRYSHRVPLSAGMTAIFPEWAKGLFRADLARETAHDNAGSVNVLAITDAQIEDWFTARGIHSVWTLDALKSGTYGSVTVSGNQFFPILTSGTSAPAWPNTAGTSSALKMLWFLYVEGTFQFLDGGRLDLGVVRDSLLDSTNDYETFVEVFEGLAFRGLEAYAVQSNLFPNGGSAGTVAVSSYAE